VSVSGRSIDQALQCRIARGQHLEQAQRMQARQQRTQIGFGSGAAAGSLAGSCQSRTLARKAPTLPLRTVRPLPARRSDGRKNVLWLHGEALVEVGSSVGAGRDVSAV
jgi:hypothetical protein